MQECSLSSRRVSLFRLNLQKIPPAHPESVFHHVNRQAVLSRAGDTSATQDLAHQLFLTVGVPVEIADALSYTDRIVQAQVSYHRGAHPGITEEDVVKAVNNMANELGVPLWTRTTKKEVRKLRMHMLVLYPQMMASHGPPDNNGHRKAVSEKMQPIEAAYLASTLLYQKIYKVG